MTISYDSVRRLTDIVVTHFCVEAAPPVQCASVSVPRWTRTVVGGDVLTNPDISRYQRHNEVVDKRTYVSVSI